MRVKVGTLSAGVNVRLEGGYPGGRPHAHEEGVLRCRVPQQPRHPVRLSRHEGEPAVALQEGTVAESGELGAHDV